MPAGSFGSISASRARTPRTTFCRIGPAQAEDQALHGLALPSAVTAP
jgi:hypothetical protein